MLLATYIDNMQEHHYDSKSKMSSSDRLHDKDIKLKLKLNSMVCFLLTLLGPRVMSPGVDDRLLAMKATINPATPTNIEANKNPR